MRVNPVNTNYNTNFKADIKPTSSLKKGFEMMSKYVDSANMKHLNSVKDFIDSLARISETKKVNEFKIEIDKKRENYTYTKINGRRVSGGHNDRQPQLQDSYMVIEGTKRYASNCEEIEPSVLDMLKSQIEEAENKLDELKLRYGNRLKSELEQAQKLIFNETK